MTKKKNVNKPTAPAKVEASTSVSEGTPPSNEAAAPNDELQSSEILQDAVALVAEHNKETDENKLRFTHQDQIAHKNFKLQAPRNRRVRISSTSAKGPSNCEFQHGARFYRA